MFHWHRLRGGIVKKQLVLMHVDNYFPHRSSGMLKLGVLNSGAHQGGLVVEVSEVAWVQDHSREL